MGPVLAAYLHDIDPWVFQITESFGVRWYGLAYVAGFVAGYFLLKLLARNGYGELKPDEVGDFITYAAICGGMLGGRLGFMLFYDFSNFVRDPLSLFRVWEGGMASHGGILGLAVFAYVYARRKGYNWAGLGDNLVSVAPLGVFFGRIANFINGELYGKPTDRPWAMKFPEEMERQEIWAEVSRRLPNYQFPAQVKAALGEDPRVEPVLREVLTPRHPSQLYQAGLEGLALFAILFFIRWRYKNLPPGILTGLFFLGYAAFRIVGEVFRAADYGSADILGLQKGQFYSAFMFAIGAAFLGYGWMRRPGTNSGRRAESA